MAQLRSISILNFRSVEYVALDCTPLSDGSATFGLIGLNEAGKSSILRAIALLSGTNPAPKDFRDKKQDIQVLLEYALTEKEEAALLEHLASFGYSDADKHIPRIAIFNLSINSQLSRELYIARKQKAGEDDDDWDYTLVSSFPQDIVHSAILWTAAEKYLISKPIELDAFSADPAGVSVPLRNCFRLAGIDDIKGRIAALQGDSTEIEQLHSELGTAVTKHIRRVWPNHPVTISFLIANNHINFHVKDDGVNGKAKTADQRSDGFKRFISFLLTVSAENKNEELHQAILLLDEPETHLHPLAQEYLLGELVNITRNGRGNVAFFATHSNYLIDKTDLSRNYRVTKEEEVTELQRFDHLASSYASVSFEVFGVMSIDYHGELYARLHENYQQADPNDETRWRQTRFDEEYFVQVGKLKKNKPLKGQANSATLPTFIRNCIHHPDNGDKFTATELATSISAMRKLL